MKQNKFLALLVTALMLLPLCASAASTRLLCGVVKADSWTMNNNQEGIYMLEIGDNATLTKLTEGQDVLQAPLGGAVYVDGKMEGIHFKQEYDPFEGANTYTIYRVRYDMETWTRTLLKPLSGVVYGNLISSCGLAHDAVTGVNVGIFYNFNMSFEVINRKLAVIDFSTDIPTRSIIGIVDTPMAAIAFDANGLLWGVGQDGYLYVIDLVAEESGYVTIYPVADLGISNISTYPSSMTYDATTGHFLWSVVLSTGKSYLYEVTPSLTAASATQLMQLPDNAYLVNMQWLEPEAEDNAPAAVTDLTANFEGESLTGTVTFTAPTTTYDGQTLTGDLTYTVAIDGETVATGTAAPGQEVNATVTSPNNGDIAIVVTVANAAGTSPEAKVETYVGPDTPLAPTNIVLDYNYDNKQLSLTWDAPTQGTHGTTLDATRLTYDIYTMPGDEPLAQGVTETGFTGDFDPDVLAGYSFKIVPTYADMTVGEAGESPRAVIGPALNPPYTQNFANASSFDLLTVLDLNGDGNTWKWESTFGSNTGRASYFPSSENRADDWLLSPPINLKKGAVYSITLDANTALANNVDYLDVAYGQGMNTANYEMLIKHIILNEPLKAEYSNNEITPSATGVYYFGFHADSYPGVGWLLLHNFSIKMLQDAPDYLPGDVDGNGEVNGTDLNILINIILGNDNADNYDGRANVDGQGNVDGSDINALINILLGK